MTSTTDTHPISSNAELSITKNTSQLPSFYRLPQELKDIILSYVADQQSEKQKDTLAFARAMFGKALDRKSFVQEVVEGTHKLFRSVFPKKQATRSQHCMSEQGSKGNQSGGLDSSAASQLLTSTMQWGRAALLASQAHVLIKGKRSGKIGRSTGDGVVEKILSRRPELPKIRTITMEQIPPRKVLQELFGPNRSEGIERQLSSLEKLIVLPMALPWYSTCFEVGSNDALSDLMQAASQHSFPVVVKRYSPELESATSGGIHLGSNGAAQRTILNPIIVNTGVNSLTYYSGDREACSGGMILWPAITQNSIYSVRAGAEKNFHFLPRGLSLMFGSACVLADSLSVDNPNFTRQEVRIYLGDLEEGEVDTYLRNTVRLLQNDLGPLLEDRSRGETIASVPLTFIDITDIKWDEDGSRIPVPSSKAVIAAGPGYTPWQNLPLA